MKNRKKYWLLPIIFVLFIFGFLIVLTQGTAVTHVDYSARIQTVHKDTNESFHKL